MTARKLPGGGFEGTFDEVCDALGIPPGDPYAEEALPVLRVLAGLEEAERGMQAALDALHGVPEPMRGTLGSVGDLRGIASAVASRRLRAAYEADAIAAKYGRK